MAKTFYLFYFWPESGVRALKTLDFGLSDKTAAGKRPEKAIASLKPELFFLTRLWGEF
jgi:hypothetical protein